MPLMPLSDASHRRSNRTPHPPPARAPPERRAPDPWWPEGQSGEAIDDSVAADTVVTADTAAQFGRRGHDSVAADTVGQQKLEAVCEISFSTSKSAIFWVRVLVIAEHRGTARANRDGYRLLGLDLGLGMVIGCARVFTQCSPSEAPNPTIRLQASQYW
jgi:hypothetical protein